MENLNDPDATGRQEYVPSLRTAVVYDVLICITRL